MCGIFAYVGTKMSGSSLMLKGLKDLEYRGYDSWGVAVLKDGRWYVEKEVGKIKDIKKIRLPESNMAFGHTRWATHGGVTKINAHPHLDCSRNIVIIHNGIIENHEALKVELTRKGHIFISQTDSEVFAHLVEEYAKRTTFKEAVRISFSRCVGQSAIIASSTFGDEFIALRNGSPLVIGFGKNEKYIASDPQALAVYTKSMYFMGNNELATVTKDKVVISDVISGKVMKKAPQEIHFDQKKVGKSKHKHFMIKEIFDQPQVMKKILSTKESVTSIVGDMRQKKTSVFVGSGSAYHAAEMARYIFAQVASKKIEAEESSQALEILPFLSKKDLIVAMSQSGETMDVLELVQMAKEKGITVDSLVNIQGSSLYRESKHQILLNAGREKAVASTKAFIAKLTYICMMAYVLNGSYESGKSRLNRAISEIVYLSRTKTTKRVKSVAKAIAGKANMFIVGRGISYVTSLETALKIKEVAYIHAQGYRGSEVKHGPIALIEAGTPCLMFIPNDKYLSDNISTVQELKARGGYIIGVSPLNSHHFDLHIPVPDIGVETTLANVVVGQLLAYYLSIQKGIDPDMPRNLAKSVTVK